MERNDKARGLGKQVKGELKDTYGQITGDTSKQVEGKADKVVGKVQETIGRAKDDMRKPDDHGRDRV